MSRNNDAEGERALSTKGKSVSKVIVALDMVSNLHTAIPERPGPFDEGQRCFLGHFLLGLIEGTRRRGRDGRFSYSPILFSPYI